MTPTPGDEGAPLAGQNLRRDARGPTWALLAIGLFLGGNGLWVFSQRFYRPMRKPDGKWGVAKIVEHRNTDGSGVREFVFDHDWMVRIEIDTDGDRKFELALLGDAPPFGCERLADGEWVRTAQTDCDAALSKLAQGRAR